ncbi:calcium-binding protein P-like [Ptychodera flava]|uniref:calcium-binding protein P-like n=1 Tax=Ptychodera flava TaxID=63121 RepID=UPI00396AA77A
MDENAAYQQRGIALIIIGIMLAAGGIFMIAFLSSWFYYGALCVMAGIGAVVLGASLKYRARNRITTIHTAQQPGVAGGPTVVTTTGTTFNQYGQPPPAYGQYPSSNPADFPPGLGPGGPQPGPQYSQAPHPGQAPPYGTETYQAPPYSAAPPPGTYGKDPNIPGQAY